jgi:glutaredoxin 3
MSGSPSTAPKRIACATHGLATAPDGYCVLCRRERGSAAMLPAAPQRAEPDPYPLSWGARAKLALLALAAVFSCALALWWARDIHHAAQRQAQLAANAALSASVTQAPASAPRTDTAATTQLDDSARAKVVTEALAAELAARQRAADDEQRVQLEQRAREEAEQDRRRHEMIEADRLARVTRTARQSVSIVMYSTPWCPSCKAAHAYMDEKGIAFTDIDIEQSESARAIMRRLNPRGSVPTLDIDGAVMVGFSPRHLEQEIDGAAEKRAARF